MKPSGAFATSLVSYPPPCHLRSPEQKRLKLSQAQKIRVGSWFTLSKRGDIRHYRKVKYCATSVINVDAHETIVLSFFQRVLMLINITRYSQDRLSSIWCTFESMKFLEKGIAVLQPTTRRNQPCYFLSPDSKLSISTPATFGVILLFALFFLMVLGKVERFLIPPAILSLHRSINFCPPLHGSNYEDLV